MIELKIFSEASVVESAIKQTITEDILNDSSIIIYISFSS